MKINLLLLTFLFLQFNSTRAENNSVGFPCNQSSFYALNNTGDVVELEVSGNTIISHGTVLTGVPGSGLAICNNVDGGTYNPTVYSCTSTNISHYNGATWDTVNFTPQTYMGGCGGYGNNLFYTQPGSNHPYIYVYNSGILSGLTISMSPAVADIAVDVDGNIWYFAGSNQISTSIRQLSPTGTLLKEYNCYIDTYNAYGCFLLNGVLYVGLGQYNTTNPNKIIPITFTIDSAYVGTPMSMPVATYSDFASCNPGLPVSIDENSFDKSLMIYPNPAGNQLTISATLDVNSYSVYDIKGAKIMSGLINTNFKIIDTGNLNSGIYFIELETPNGYIRKKLIRE